MATRLDFTKTAISSGKSMLILLSSPVRKNIPLCMSGKSEALVRPSRAHKEGRFAVVTNVGRRMRWTLALRLTSEVQADGEVVWS